MRHLVLADHGLDLLVEIAHPEIEPRTGMKTLGPGAIPDRRDLLEIQPARLLDEKRDALAYQSRCCFRHIAVAPEGEDEVRTGPREKIPVVREGLRL